MSDYRERACTKCGSLLHHESKCVAAEHAAARTDNCNGAECERAVRELRQRHQDDVVYAYGMGQENGLRAAIDIFSRNTVGPEDDSRTNQYAKSSIRGMAPPLSGESAAAGLLAECERAVRELRQELETARQHAENLESALKIEKDERDNLQMLRARDVHSAEDAYVRCLDEVIELKRVWSAKIGELEQQHTADQERIRELEKDLNQLAGVVGQALLVRTLAVGESLKEPSEHAIVQAMLMTRDERDTARSELSCAQELLTKVNEEGLITEARLERHTKMLRRLRNHAQLGPCPYLLDEIDRVLSTDQPMADRATRVVYVNATSDKQAEAPACTNCSGYGEVNVDRIGDDPTGHQEPYPQCRPVEQYTTPARQARTDELTMVRAEVDRTAKVVRALSAAVNNTGYSGAECVRLLIWEVEKLSKLRIRQVALEDAAAKTTSTATIERKEQD